MKSIAIICPRQNLIFDDLAQAICISFMELGWISIRIETRDEIQSLAKDIEYALIITPFDYPGIKRLLPNTKLILYQTEILPWINHLGTIQSLLGYRCNSNWKRLQPLLENYDIIFDYDKINIENNLQYSCTNKRVKFLPVGYSSCFEIKGSVDTIDTALFVGNITRYRRRILNRIRKRCGQLRQINNVYQKDAIKLMRGASINLNLHSYDLPMFESPRIVRQLFSNRAFVLSEPCQSAPEFQNGIHWGVADSQFFPSMIKFYLKHPDVRLQMADNAYNFIVKHYTMTRNLEQALR